ncbi:hypothetical protein [Pseudomonas serbica]|uniref:hypothetical protein n=1 Tax=Pseudomonas serbica TaxID=2965074 RepID=UPI00237ABB1F|nr:hypothetical protein [Pseudomonas serbica]
MEYFDFDGNLNEVVGGLEFKIEKRPHDNPRYEEICPGGKTVLVTSEILQPKTADEFFDMARRIIASYPPFINPKDCSWMLAYISKIEESMSSNHFGFNQIVGVKRRTLSESDVYRFIENPDPVSITRFLYTFDVLERLFSGYLGVRDYFNINKNVDATYSSIDAELLLGDKESYRLSQNLDRSKSFKSTMTRGFYGGTDVIITIPDGEELVSQSMHGKKMIIGSGAKFEGTMVRFYKTEPFWANRANFEFYPTITGAIRPTLVETPMFAMTLEMAKGVENILSGRMYGAYSGFHGYSINAFIPLHWISHTLIDSEFYEVSNHPTPKPCFYDPMEGTMPMIEFLKGFAG